MKEEALAHWGLSRRKTNTVLGMSVLSRGEQVGAEVTTRGCLGAVPLLEECQYLEPVVLSQSLKMCYR